MTNGYPAEADIVGYLADLGIEIPTENVSDYYGQFRQFVYGIADAGRWALSLGVYCPSATTFNVRGGDYMFIGTLKEYTPGDAIDPTDNDTTYVWIDDNNTVDSGVDGDGWPGTEHIKLAEIVVDSDGVITAVTDRRGQAFLQYLSNYITGSNIANVSSNGGLSVIFTATLTAGSTVAVHNVNAPFKYRIVDAWSIATSADGGTWKITDGTHDISNTVTVTGTDKTINRAGTLDDAYNEIAADGSLSVVGDGANADCQVYVLAVRVS